MNHKEFSRKGGQAKSDKKADAARKNARKPRGKYVTAIAYEFTADNGETRFGCAMVKRKVNAAIMAEIERAIYEGCPWEEKYGIAELMECSTVTMRM